MTLELTGTDRPNHLSIPWAPSREEGRPLTLRKRLVGIDIIRFFAAVAVMYYHLTFWAERPGASNAAKIVSGHLNFPETASTAWLGWIGVQIFFVISGAMIAESSRNTNPMRFAVGRVLRIYPTAWLCSLATVAVVLAFNTQPIATTLVGFAGQVTLFPGTHWLDGSYWTLPIELMFYGVVFFLMSISRRDHLRALAFWLIFLSAAYATLQTLAPGADFGRMVRIPYATALLEYGCYFGLGIILALPAGERGRSSSLAVLAALVSACLQIRHHVISDFGQVTAVKILVPVAIWLVVVCCIWLSIDFSERIDPHVEKMQSSIRTLGLITYPLYLVHQVCGAAIMRVAVDWGLGRWIALGLAASACFVWAWCIVAVDRRLRRYMERRLWSGTRAAMRAEHPA